MLFSLYKGLHTRRMGVRAAHDWLTPLLVISETSGVSLLAGSRRGEPEEVTRPLSNVSCEDPKLSRTLSSHVAQYQ